MSIVGLLSRVGASMWMFTAPDVGAGLALSEVGTAVADGLRTGVAGTSGTVSTSISFGLLSLLLSVL